MIDDVLVGILDKEANEDVGVPGSTDVPGAPTSRERRRPGSADVLVGILDKEANEDVGVPGKQRRPRER